MAADGMIGNGTKFAYSSSSPVSWTNIGQLLDINGLELVRDKIDRTVHTTNIQKRSLPGMAEVTDFECTVLSDPDESTTQGAIQKALRDLVAAGTTVWWRLEIPVDRAQTAYKAFEFQGKNSPSLFPSTVMASPSTKPERRQFSRSSCKLSRQ
jgi:hypothetical protein